MDALQQLSDTRETRLTRLRTNVVAPSAPSRWSPPR
jgi:hypothetical protein